MRGKEYFYTSRHNRGGKIGKQSPPPFESLAPATVPTYDTVKALFIVGLALLVKRVASCTILAQIFFFSPHLKTRLEVLQLSTVDTKQYLIRS